MKRITQIAALLAAGLLGTLAITSYAESLADTITRGTALRNAAEAGCVIDGQLYAPEGDC